MTGRRLFLTVLALAIPLMTHPSVADGQTSTALQATTATRAADAIRYTVRFPAPHTHYAEIAAEVPTDGRPQVELMMAVWTPGSYLVREYARHVESVAATAGGRPLAVEKSQKNRWRVATGGARQVTVTYKVYGREMSVRTNWIEAGFALLNGAPTFLTLADRTPRPHEVVLMPAAGWRRSMTSLDALSGGEHRYVAPDYDTLVDSPILLGNPTVHEFTVDGKRHYLVNEGEAGVFDGARAAQDLQRIVEAQRAFWGQLPYERYLFLNVITEARGGLEHKGSTVLMTSRWATRSRTAYLEWLQLASHELFHAWNVKRLRPVELGPFDYERENYTRSLWAVEGITDYYGDLFVRRAGLCSREEFLDSLSAKVDEVQSTPGRSVQPTALASFDAWIKYYRPDENSPNVALSYYDKGAVVAFLLDAKIRRATRGQKSLDDVMRAAYARYAGAKGYTPEEFRAVADDVAGTNLKTFWDNYVQGTAELDYAEALDVMGVRFRPGAPTTKAWLGLKTRVDGGRLLVSEVRRDTPAWNAGLNVDDELLAIGDFRVRADGLEQRLGQYRAGERAPFLIARRDAVQKLDVTFGAEPARSWRLEANATATAEQLRMQADWLKL